MATTRDQDDTPLTQAELESWVAGWTAGGQQAVARTLCWLKDRGCSKEMAVDYLRDITRRASSAEQERADHLLGLADLRAHGVAREA